MLRNLGDPNNDPAKLLKEAMNLLEKTNNQQSRLYRGLTYPSEHNYAPTTRLRGRQSKITLKVYELSKTLANNTMEFIKSGKEFVVTTSKKVKSKILNRWLSSAIYKNAAPFLKAAEDDPNPENIKNCIASITAISKKIPSNKAVEFEGRLIEIINSATPATLENLKAEISGASSKPNTPPTESFSERGISHNILKAIDAKLEPKEEEGEKVDITAPG